MEPKWIFLICAVIFGTLMGYSPFIIVRIIKRSAKLDLAFKIAALRIKQDDEGLSWFEEQQLKKLKKSRNQAK